jgi:AbrB family looped-hinge helix DNA binding protein
MKATISSKGAIVLPAEIRQRDDIRAGEEVHRIARGAYLLKRLKRARNEGLVQLIVACPVKDWFSTGQPVRNNHQIFPAVEHPLLRSLGIQEH